ncbi:GntR family transcriptional regulator [Streptosporangium sp. NPDC006007]|uniref:GntR family transcriptional regulator n=1 Tax=Streptosporangium sp. NPDC006007 TaxID=3154575 RepID=UPI0033A4E5F1
MINQGEWVWEEGTARWRQLYAVLRDRIESGVYPSRRLIPSLIQMEEEFGLARNTVRKALVRLAREGYVRPEQGVGTVVRPQEEWKPETGEE